MKRKLLTALIILLCFCSLTVLTSCDAILDMIFGPSTPPAPNPDDTHVHQMEQKTFDGENCSGQEAITYYKCSGCGKCYLDQQGNELIDETSLGAGHVYVLKYDDSEHYRECALCHTEQDGSRQAHEAGAWQYNSQQHFKQCKSCEMLLEEGAHDETGTCTVCGRRADYVAMCNGRYAYNRLIAEFANGENMQKLYDKLDEEVKSAHDDEKRDFAKTEIATGEFAYALSIKCFDYRITSEQAFALVTAYRNDNPLYYWLSSRVGMITRTSGNETYADTIHICVDDDYRLGADRAALNAKIYEGIDEYLSYASAEKDNVYFLTLALHDKVIDNANYAYQADGVTPANDVWAHNIVGVFDNKTAVCEGYAKAFQLLLNACNVNNVYVTGASRGEGHAWNMVQLADNQWYWYDLTWDDQPNLGRGVIYTYFCVTDDEFTEDHTVSSQKSGINYLYDLPQAETEQYQHNGLVMGEKFTDNGLTYQLVGYNRLSVDKCIMVGADGVVSIPAAVKQGDYTYSVAEISDETFVNYTYNDKGEVVTKTSPLVTRVIIPETVDLIYNKSFIECNTIMSVEFADVNGWSRYGMTGKSPVYEKISPEQLSRDVNACHTLKQLHKEDKNYYCVWVKN